MNQERCQLQGDFPRKIELLLIILTGAASGQEIAARVEPLQRRTHRRLQPDGLAFPTKGRVSVKDELLKLLPLLPVEVVADLLPELAIVDEAVQLAPRLLEVFRELDVLADLVPRSVEKSSYLVFVFVVRRGGTQTRDALPFLALVLEEELDGVKVLAALVQGHEKEPLVFGRPTAPRSLLLLSGLTVGNLLTGLFNDDSGLCDVIAEALRLFPLLLLLPQDPGTDSETLATRAGQTGLVIGLIIMIRRSAVGLWMLGPVGRASTFSGLAFRLKPSLGGHRFVFLGPRQIIIRQAGKKIKMADRLHGHG